MGIPAFFRWLSDKYPRMTARVREANSFSVDGIETIVDATQPNPNGLEFDNLYLDMNGIIHPCCHPEGRPPPATEDEMYVEIYRYIDRIMNMIRPRRVLYMAVDGVAPRAKMNQQRSRRFRAALEAEFPEMVADNLKKDLKAQGTPVKEKTEGEKFDSNCITPGTPFMDRLSIALRYYVADRMNNNPAWRGIKVIVSDASVPGEGEHKIMDYIRRQRNQRGYYPNTRHVLYGLDADLIMLALATHEPNFHILREDVFHKPDRDFGNKGAFGADPQSILKPFIFLHVYILREYLRAELSVESDSRFRFDLDRAIDDWIFMCSFVGNDFLPHLPSLEIREGAIDKLIAIWKGRVKYWGGYLTDSGKINLKLVEPLMMELGKHEDRVFVERKDTEDRREASRRRRGGGGGGDYHRNGDRDGGRGDGNNRRRQREDDDRSDEPPRIVQLQEEHQGDSALINPSYVPPEQRIVTGTPGTGSIVAVAVELPSNDDVKDSEQASTFVEGNEEEKVDGAEVPNDESLDEEDSIEETNSVDPVEDTTELKRKFADVPLPTDNILDEDVKLWEVGWKQRYYTSKFQVDVSDDRFRREVVTKYVEGLCWVLQYYFQGCQSWNWYYPYHYAPFASDFDFIADVEVKFDRGEPFHPFEQLMAVLPAYSGKHIPEPYRKLMTSEDSTILDFYPRTFKIDLNGKKFIWQGVALLPFIDEERLLTALRAETSKLSADERRRNGRGNEVLFVSSFTTLYDHICDRIDYSKPFETTDPELKDEEANGKQVSVPQVTRYEIDWRLAQKFFGSFSRDPIGPAPGGTIKCPFPHLGLHDVKSAQSVSVYYYMPSYPVDFRFPARRLPGAKEPRPCLSPQEIYEVRNGIVRRGGYGGGNRGGSGRGGGPGRFNGPGRFSNQDRRNSGGRGGGGGDHRYGRGGDSSEFHRQRRMIPDGYTPISRNL